MKSRSRVLCDHSIAMALSAIEIYNKPDFYQREQIFSILMVNAWETLFKARILSSNKNKMTSIYVKEANHYKRNKRGVHLTIDVLNAMGKCSVARLVELNITYLVEVRNAATHLTAKSKALPILLFSLGAASLKNYASLLSEWFRISLNEYSFYILPLGFTYPFSSLTSLELSRESADIAALARSVAADQDQPPDKDGFNLVCELRTTLISAKKVTHETDITAAIGESGEFLVVQRDRDLKDRYPLTYQEAWRAVRAELPLLKQSAFNSFIRENGIKSNARYASYSYLSKSQEQKGPKAGTTTIYNQDFVEYCKAALAKKD